MNSFYLYDGQNEAGPFTLDELRKQHLTRTTPIRQKDTDQWMPAEKLAALKPHVVPRKIRHPKDVLPAVAENFSVLHRERPKTLYAVLFCMAMFAGLSFYSLGKASVKPLPKPDDATTDLHGPTVLPPTEIAPVKQTETNATHPAAGIKEEKEDAAKTTRLHWRKLISATHSNYGIGFLGGIKDLSVTVTNRTDFPLDEVVANVTYVKANGSIWKTVPVTLYNVPPLETKEQSLPDVGRGKKVKVSLQKVISKKMNFSYAEGQKGKDTDDPYYKE